MPKWMADIQLRAKAAKSFVTNTATQTLSFAKYVYRSVELPARTVDLLMDAGEGFTRVAYPSNWFGLIRSPKARTVLKHSAISVSYGLIALFYDMVVRKTVRTYASEPVADTAIPLMDALTLYLLCRQAMGAMADKLIYNASISKAAYQEANADFLALKGCGCQMADIVPGMLMSPFYYLGDVVAIHMVCAYLPGGAYLMPPLVMLREGQALLEYQISARGYCEKHMLDVMNKNNGYAFGYGASYVVLSWTMNGVLSIITDRHNPLITKAFDSLLYQYFIFMAYQIDRPLPGKKPGVDFFRYSRLVTQTMVKEVAVWLEKQINQKKTATEWAHIQKHVTEFPPFKLSVRLLVPSRLKSLDEYIHSRAGELYLNYFGDSLQGTIEWVLNLREQTLVMRINSVSGYLPKFIMSDTTAKLLSVALDEKMESVLKSADDFLEKVGRSAPAKVKIYDRPSGREDAPVDITMKFLDNYDPANASRNKVEEKLRQRQTSGASSPHLFQEPKTTPQPLSGGAALVGLRR